MLAQEKPSRYVLRIVSQICSMKKNNNLLSPVTEEQRVKLLKKMGLLYTSNNQCTSTSICNMRFLISCKTSCYCGYFITAIRDVRYDDIYRMDEIKSLSFHIIFYHLFCDLSLIDR